MSADLARKWPHRPTLAHDMPLFEGKANRNSRRDIGRHWPRYRRRCPAEGEKVVELSQSGIRWAIQHRRKNATSADIGDDVAGQFTRDIGDIATSAPMSRVNSREFKISGMC
jgi:hypothetical protein